MKSKLERASDMSNIRLLLFPLPPPFTSSTTPHHLFLYHSPLCLHPSSSLANEYRTWITRSVYRCALNGTLHLAFEMIPPFPFLHYDMSTLAPCKINALFMRRPSSPWNVSLDAVRRSSSIDLVFAIKVLEETHDKEPEATDGRCRCWHRMSDSERR